MRHAARYGVEMKVCPYCAADGKSSPLYDLREETITIMSLVHVRQAKVVNAQCLACRTPFCPFDVEATNGMFLCSGVGMSLPFFGAAVRRLCSDGTALGRTTRQLLDQALTTQHHASCVSGGADHAVHSRVPTTWSVASPCACAC